MTRLVYAPADDEVADPFDEVVIEPLTTRELEVLSLVASGAHNREIARELRVTVKTVEFHLGNVLGKLGVQSRTGAVVRALQLGWLRLAVRSRDVA
jgi:DNA-binding NarL/FixJ family response regulator